jgi:hypothetical protein
MRQRRGRKFHRDIGKLPLAMADRRIEMSDAFSCIWIGFRFFGGSSMSESGFPSMRQGGPLALPDAILRVPAGAT